MLRTPDPTSLLGSRRKRVETGLEAVVGEPVRVAVLPDVVPDVAVDVAGRQS